MRANNIHACPPVDSTSVLDCVFHAELHTVPNDSLHNPLRPRSTGPATCCGHEATSRVLVSASQRSLFFIPLPSAQRELQNADVCGSWTLPQLYSGVPLVS